jgi:hypothetical protein
LIQPLSFKRYRFPPDVIRYAVWLYFRFTLSLRGGLIVQSMDAAKTTIALSTDVLVPEMAHVRSWRQTEVVVRMRLAPNGMVVCGKAACGSALHNGRWPLARQSRGSSAQELLKIAL